MHDNEGYDGEYIQRQHYDVMVHYDVRAHYDGAGPGVSCVKGGRKQFLCSCNHLGRGFDVRSA